MARLGALLCMCASLCALAAVGGSEGVVTIDGSKVARRYDGHGGLSAGASSRLVFDYPDPQRSEILDFLFKPSYGASLHMCKVEIGGDVQSTNGAEASHMHVRSDLNYDRGYEYWLMVEAKKRNPKVQTYVLSWGVPGWVGNGSYFSADNIAYQVKFLQGARDSFHIDVDYIGVWNERPWGTVEYVVELRNALDAAGFQSTKIVGADGGIPEAQIQALAGNATFSKAEPILGTHYPCARDQPAAFWELEPAKTYWANEDFSTQGGDWNGGSCWGRSLVQNYVKLNATSTISWSTIWGVYETWRYFGNGLMYAYEPWGANYTVPPAVWTSAHVTQFVEVGWHYLDGTGCGLLPGGGSWNSLVPGTNGTQHPRPRQPRRQPPRRVAAAGPGDLTIVLEKLEGKCLRCQVPATTAETVRFRLAGPLLGIQSLSVWLTNGTLQFVQMPSVPVDGSGAFSVFVPRDTMITLTTTTGQTKGSATPTTYKPFPLPFRATYDEDPARLHKMALYHADSTGAFEVLPCPPGAAGRCLWQVSPRYPTGTQWAGNYDPITNLGAPDWVNIAVSISALIVAPQPAYDKAVYPNATEAGGPIADGPYAGVCVRQSVQWNSGLCLLVGQGLRLADKGATVRSGWLIQAGTGSLARTAGVVLASGELPALDVAHAWHRLGLSVRHNQLQATLNGTVLGRAAISAATGGLASGAGLASLRSNWHYAAFDNLSITQAQGSAAPSPTAVFDKHVLLPPAAPPGGGTHEAALRADFTGQVGVSFRVGAQNLAVTGLARFASLNFSQAHNLSVVDATSLAVVCSAALAPGTGPDAHGYAWAATSAPCSLLAGRGYYLASTETAGGDTFFDLNLVLQARPGLLKGYPRPVYEQDGKWQPMNSPDDRVYHSIRSNLTGECWDRVSKDVSGARVDTWDCVADHHNEMFNLSASGLLYIASEPIGSSFCVSAGPCPPPSSSAPHLDTALPPSFCEAACNASDANQLWAFEDNRLTVRSQAGMCVTASASPHEDAGLTAQPCVAGGTAAQAFEFLTVGKRGDTTDLPWGTGYGPLNLRLAAANE